MAGNDGRREWMGLLAKSSPSLLSRLWDKANLAPEFQVVRPAEIGTVMVRGRAGGTGAPFNLGEMTVTRCSVKLTDSTIGYGYVQGRDKRHAEQAALLDALMQTKSAATIRRQILQPLAMARNEKAAARAAKAAATKVEFFTLVRGDSE